MNELLLPRAELLLCLYSFVVFSLCYVSFLVSIVYAKLKLHKPEVPAPDRLDGVSIVKPLLGVDPYLEENLESFFKLDYPNFEILFCVHTNFDPALKIVHKLIRKYHKSSIQTKIFTGGSTGMVNPMVSNMAPAYNAAQYDLVWITSSRIKASKEMILDMVAKSQKENSGIVHQIPFLADKKGCLGALEKGFFGSDAARFYIASNIFGVNCVTGMSYMVSKALLDSIGGLGYYGKYLAEDYFLSKAIQNKGLRHPLSAIPAQQNYMLSLENYKNRCVRWARLRVHHVPHVVILLEPWQQCFLTGIFVAWSVNHLSIIDPVHFFVCHVIAWLICDYTLIRLMQNGSLAVTKVEFLKTWLMREFIFLFVLIEVWSDMHVIQWGKRRFHLQFGGLTQEVTVDKVIDKNANEIPLYGASTKEKLQPV